MPVKFADTFNGTFFCWNYLLRLSFPFSPVHCCASRTACFFVNQNGEIEIVWVNGGKKRKGRFLVGLFKGRSVSWAICSADAQAACSSTREARRVLAERGRGASERYLELLLLSRACCRTRPRYSGPCVCVNTGEKDSVPPARVHSALTERRA